MSNIRIKAFTWELVHSEKGGQVWMNGMICKDVMLLLNLRHGATQVVENLHRIRLTLLILEIKRGSPNNQNDNLNKNV